MQEMAGLPAARVGLLLRKLPHASYLRSSSQRPGVIIMPAFPLCVTPATRSSHRLMREGRATV